MEVAFLYDIRIEVYPALEGDCFLISIGNEIKTNILIDGGLRKHIMVI